MNLQSLQLFLGGHRIHAWLLHDFRGSNPLIPRILARKRWTTRRLELYLPADGPPELLLHTIDASQFHDLATGGIGNDVIVHTYSSWQELHAWLAQRISGQRIAVDYSPGGALPAVSYIDAGTAELLRGLGAELVCSADLIQVSIAAWSAEALENHRRASREVTRIKDAAFDFIRQRLAGVGDVQEYQVQQLIMAEFHRAGLETDEPPVVAVNAHSGDPHYTPARDRTAPIRRGDWVLIDLWARIPGEENIYSDITWVGFCGRDVPAKHREVFAVVKEARDAALRLAQSLPRAAGSAAARGSAFDHADHGQRSNATAAHATLQGWQLDDAARAPIIAAGYQHAIRHRTGHSLSPGPLVHGLGMNLDNFETRDTRAMLPGIGFTIEPGIYLPEFGVRLEINIYNNPAAGATVTSCIQDEILLLA